MRQNRPKDLLANGLHRGRTWGSTGVMSDALQQRATQDRTRGGKAFEEPLTSLDGLLVCHP